jgi:Ni,Fe-hydrogenase I small subunit
MSYGASAALQTAVYQALTAAPALAGVAVYDAVPPSPPGTFVLVGPEEVRDASDKTGAGAEHLIAIGVISDGTGFLAAKTIAAAISDTLAGAALVLSRGVLVSLLFQRASARRIDEGEVRRIDLTFRARIEL